MKESTRNKVIGAGIVIVFAAMLLGSFSRPASGQAVGEQWELTGYCLDTEDARALSEASRKQGKIGYTQFLKADKNTCRHYKLHEFVAPTVTLIEKLWTVRAKGGEVLQFWLARDAKGAEYYTWYLMQNVSV